MAAALALARRGLGRVHPNPAVGCIIVAGGRVLGRGYTGPGGRPHAEANALADAWRHAGADAVHGATAYVTLEPCAHHGQTPPCADALAKAGIARVVCPLGDPDPRVDGKGFAALRAAGVTVETGLMAEAAAALNAGFLSRVGFGRPRVLLKLAASLDGRIATARGESRWITSGDARRRVHLMRAEADAVLVGAGTARTDDPTLDVRLAGLEARCPLRVVADPALSLSLIGRLAMTAAERPLLLFHRPGVDTPRREAWLGLGARLEMVEVDGEGLDMRAVLHRLGALGINTVLVEGGARLAATLLRRDLVDEIAWFAAGSVLGGDGFPAVSSFGLQKLADAPRFELAGFERIGPDTLARLVRR